MSFDRERSAGYMTNWAARLFARAIDQRLKASASRRVTCRYSSRWPAAALTQKELARLAAIEQPTMAATLARMERDGLIERRADPDDGRSSLVSLSAKARRKAELVTQAIAEINGRRLRRSARPNARRSSTISQRSSRRSNGCCPKTGRADFRRDATEPLLRARASPAPAFGI